MPIRINLLAEAQALEDLRKRDPVKRAILAGVGLVIVVMAFAGSLQFRAMLANHELHRVASQVGTRTNEFQQVLANQRKLADMNRKLSMLQQMATNRVLHGTILNALQRTAMDEVQLTRLKTEEAYIYNEEIKAKTNSNDRIIPGRPASVTEKVVVTLEAKDNGVNPGDQVNKFKEAIAGQAYFKPLLNKTNAIQLVNLSPPEVGFDGKPYVLFSLEAHFNDQTR